MKDNNKAKETSNRWYKKQEKKRLRRSEYAKNLGRKSQ